MSLRNKATYSILLVAASSSMDSHIRLWDLDSGKQIKSIDCGPGKIIKTLRLLLH